MVCSSTPFLCVSEHKFQPTVSGGQEINVCFLYFNLISVMSPCCTAGRSLISLVQNPGVFSKFPWRVEEVRRTLRRGSQGQEGLVHGSRHPSRWFTAYSPSLPSAGPTGPVPCGSPGAQGQARVCHTSWAEVSLQDSLPIVSPLRGSKTSQELTSGPLGSWSLWSILHLFAASSIPAKW